MRYREPTTSQDFTTTISRDQVFFEKNPHTCCYHSIDESELVKARDSMTGLYTGQRVGVFWKNNRREIAKDPTALERKEVRW